jgi:hypothetical protein
MRPRVYAALMASTYGYVEFLLKQLQLNVEVPADKHSGSVADQYLTRKRSPMQLIADIEKLSRAKIAHPLKLELELLTIVRDSFVHNQMYLRSAKLSRFKHLLANLCALRDTTGIGNIADTIEVTGENHLLQMTDQFLEASCTSLKFTLYRVLRLVDELLDNRQAVCDHGRSR